MVNTVKIEKAIASENKEQQNEKKMMTRYRLAEKWTQKTHNVCREKRDNDKKLKDKTKRSRSSTNNKK